MVAVSTKSHNRIPEESFVAGVDGGSLKILEHEEAISIYLDELKTRNSGKQDNEDEDDGMALMG